MRVTLLIVTGVLLITSCRKTKTSTADNKPQAVFSYNILNPDAFPVTVQFLSISKNANTHEWHFGDGATSGETNPEHVYNEPGTYTVNLIVRNSSGDSSVTSAIITINNNHPRASYTYTIVNPGQLPCKVIFTNTSTNANSYFWDFGLGYTSTETNPVQYFPNYGWYYPKLVARNGALADSIVDQQLVIPASVPQSLINKSVRVIYLVTSDKKFDQYYFVAIENCIKDLKIWYKNQMNGKTFKINNQIVEVIYSPRSSAWFNANNGSSISGTDAYWYGFSNARYETNRLLGGLDIGKYVYLVYYTAFNAHGGGGPGFTAMPEDDLVGLIGKDPYFGINRWIGGSGHELGHAFGLAHPANQDPNALMWSGYSSYPNCYLTAEDKTTLNNSLFFQ